jgi:16S rRNA (guanine527-N7)-methyltransferase
MSHNDRLDHYHDLLLKWQKTINLVSPATLNNAWERHFEDSQQLIQYIPNHVKTIVDIGSGAGFPGLVIAIERPNIQVHLVESDTRKCAFLRTVSRETSCENVTIHNDRIENVIDDIDADMISARALASIRQLMIYTKPVWKNGDDITMLLPKGQNFQDEIEDALTKFNFEYTQHKSVTDPHARILIVGKIVQK